MNLPCSPSSVDGNSASMSGLFVTSISSIGSFGTMRTSRMRSTSVNSGLKNTSAPYALRSKSSLGSFFKKR